jgi:predicted regulator of Ras-like GTPase activity (Roadblock/LC7/MglB family)
MNAHAKHEGLPGEDLAMPVDPDLDPSHEAEILVLTPRAPEPNDGIEMDADIAEYWELWSEQIGHALVPVLEKLEKSLPGFTSAMICTADGFNLCTLGVEEDQVTRLSAMTSSLHSIADVMSTSVHEGDELLDVLSLSNGSSSTVLMAIRHLIIGQVLLWVTAENDTLGALLMRARVAARDVSSILRDR